MNKLLSTLLLVMLSGITVSAQDLIVTNTGDSINCKITKIRPTYIYFIFKYEDKVRSTTIPKSEVSYFTKGYYANPEVPDEKLATKDYSKVGLGFHGGLSYTIGKISPDLPTDLIPYIQQLKSGIHLGGDVSFFTSKYMGFGLKYTLFRTQNQIDEYDFTYQNAGFQQQGKLEDDITVQFIGPTFCARQVSRNNKLIFNSSSSIGYLTYVNRAIVINPFRLSSEILATEIDIGLDFILDKNYTLGFNISLLMGKLYHYEVYDYSSTFVIDLEAPESVTRFDFSIALKWNK